MVVNRTEGGMSRRYRARVLLNVVVASLLSLGVAIGSVIFMREWSYRRDLRFDLTRDHRYELDPLAKQLLRILETPLKIELAWGFDSDIRNRVLDAQGYPRQDLLEVFYRPIVSEAWRRIEQVLLEWSRFSGQVEYRTFNADYEPQRLSDLAKTLGVSPDEVVNHVILECGGRRRVVPLRKMMKGMEWGVFPAQPGAERLEPRAPGAWLVHEELVATLRALLMGEMKTILVAQGHGSVLEEGSGEAQRLRNALQSDGFDLVPSDLRRLPKISADVDAVLLPALTSPLSAGEVSLLRDYEDAGGRILIYADPRLPENYSRILERFGVRLLDAWIEDRSLAHPGRRGPADLQSARLCNGLHPIDTPLKNRIELYAGPCRPIRVEKDTAAGARRTTLLRASSDARSVPCTYGPTSGAPPRDEASAAPPPRNGRTLAIALERPRGGSDRPARIVVYGGASFLAPKELAASTFFGNRDLLQNTLSWLTDQESAIGLAPRSEVQARVVTYERVARPAFLTSMVVFPGLAALLALLLWLQRRS